MRAFVVVMTAAVLAAGCGGPAKEPSVAAEEQMSAEDKAALEALEKMSREMDAAITETKALNEQMEKVLGEAEATRTDAQQTVDDANRVLNGEEPVRPADH
ncbi:MAG: hypothetical protein Q8R82_01465 [Hyphomonadaceae bacterium]|nr:hypothetical protein [Hyphomonadaceae bacterium]